MLGTSLPHANICILPMQHFACFIRLGNLSDATFQIQMADGNSFGTQLKITREILPSLRNTEIFSFPPLLQFSISRILSVVSISPLSFSKWRLRQSEATLTSSTRHCNGNSNYPLTKTRQQQ